MYQGEFAETRRDVHQRRRQQYAKPLRYSAGFHNADVHRQTNLATYARCLHQLYNKGDAMPLSANDKKQTPTSRTRRANKTFLKKIKKMFAELKIVFIFALSNIKTLKQ